MRYLTVALMFLASPALAQTFTHPNKAAIETEIGQARTLLDSQQANHIVTSNIYLHAQMTDTPTDCTATHDLNWQQPSWQTDSINNLRTIDGRADTVQVRCNWSVDSLWQPGARIGYMAHCTCHWNAEKWRYSIWFGPAGIGTLLDQWYIYEQ